VEGNLVENGYFISLKLPGYLGQRVTQKMLEEFRLKAAFATPNKHGVLIFKDKEYALRCAHRVELHITDMEEET
jgi:hypothetical protein